ncbi:MAG: hypothetical protein IJP86_02530 [Synergistaceae bacterium]|nr:hypothetical protein [Synergistaceae bacterium]
MKLRRMLVVLLAFVLFAGRAHAGDILRVGVLKFDVKTSGFSSANAASASDELTRMLASSYSIAVTDRYHLEAIAREHRLNLSGLVDPRTAAELGRLAGVQYIIAGAVTGFSKNETSQAEDKNAWVGVLFGKTLGEAVSSKKVEKTEEAEVTLDVQIIDVSTAEVALAIAETGTARSTTSGKSSGTSDASSRKQSVNLQDAAVSDAVARIGQRIKEKVTGEHPQVLGEGSREIILSIGATSGVKVGNIYKISAEGEEIRDMRGNVLGRRTTPIAVVVVSEVQNDFSAARIAQNGGNISLVRRGDRIESISQREFSDLVQRNAFPRSRPVGSSSLEGRELDSRLGSISRTDPAPEEKKPEGTVGASFADDGMTLRRSSSTKLENTSTSSAKVIASYGLSDSEARSLKEHHRQAENMLSRDEKFDRYTELFRDHPYDYFAAYQAAKIMYDIGHYREAKEWAEKSLSVNPRYSPAKKLSKAASANM